MVKKVSIPLSALISNVGQITGLPPNPRLIKDEKFEALKKSLTDDPEMLDLRELIIYPNPDEKGTYVVIGGNMRYNAAKELGLSELPCKILPESTPVEKMRSFIIKDNIAYGEWDMDLLSEEWDTEELSDWGLDLQPYLEDLNIDDFLGRKQINERRKKLSIALIVGRISMNLRQKKRRWSNEKRSHYLQCGGRFPPVSERSGILYLSIGQASAHL